MSTLGEMAIIRGYIIKENDKKEVLKGFCNPTRDRSLYIPYLV